MIFQDPANGITLAGIVFQAQVAAGLECLGVVFCNRTVEIQAVITTMQRQMGS